MEWISDSGLFRVDRPHCVIFMDTGQGTEGLTESSPLWLLPNNRKPRKSLEFSRMQ